MNKEIPLHETDYQILQLLLENGKISNADIARRLEMAPSAIFERIRKLEERGVIEGYDVRINAKSVGLGLLAFMFVRSNEMGENCGTGERCTVADALAAIPEVIELYHIAGEDCYLAKVRAQDTDHLAKVLKEKIGSVASVVSTRTTIVFETLKDSGKLPLGELK